MTRRIAGSGIDMTLKTYWVYILTNDQDKMFYTGLTDELLRRNFEHKMGIYDGFTKKYRVHKLVYFESLTDFEKAAHRERIIKKWKRAFKIDAIERMNPYWDDLYFKLNQTPQRASLVRG
jgi:putative endonuclease